MITNENDVHEQACMLAEILIPACLFAAMQATKLCMHAQDLSLLCKTKYLSS